MFRSLRARLTLLTLVIGIVPLIAVGAVLTLRSFDQEQTKALDARHEITLRVAQQVTAFINEREIELRELIEVRGLSEISLNEQQTLLSSLLNYQPVFNELTLLDRLGEEQIRLSRQVVFSEEDLRSRSESDEFVFASVDRQTYYSPVTLDESTGEPFMTLSLPVIDRRTNDVVGVLVGQIRFRSVQELIAEVEVEGNEDVYLVDSAGKLVAHRNPSLVLGGRQFDVPDEDGAYNGLHGDRALLASTEVVLGRQRFRLVSELPESEGLRGAFQTLYLVLGALAGAVILTGLIGFLASRQFARPVNALVAAARGLGGGDLSRRAEMTGLNETDTLGQALNTMAAQVQDLVGSLEARVADRTRDLFLTLEVGQTISRSSQQKDTLQHTVDFIQDRFNLYYVQVYLIDDAQRFAILTAGTGDVGHELLTRQHRLDLRETSIVARTYQSRRPVLVTDTAASDIHRPNPLLPDTRSEVAIPLISGDEVIGVLDMQARKAETFREDNLPVFQAMSSQLSSGLRAAQFFIEMQEAVERAASINRRLTGEAWEGYLGRAGQGGRVGYRYDLQMVQPMAADSETGNGHAARIERPITLREQPIGQIVLGENSDRDWSQEEIELVDQVASRVALTLEQYRAFDETAVALAQAEVLYRASQRIAAADNTQDLLSALVESVKIPAFNRAILFTFERDSDHTVTAWNVMANWHDGRGLPPTAVSTRMPRQGNEMDLMATSNTALFFYDAQDKRFTRFDEYARTRFVERNIHALGMLPLWVGARQLGIIVLEGEESHQFAADETRALETLAGQVAVAVDGLQLLQQTQQRAAEMQTVAVVGAQASSSLDLYKLLRDVSTLTKERFELYHAHVYLLNELGDHLVLAAGAGRAGEILVAAGHRIAITNARSLVARAARSREVVITNDVTTTPDFLPNPMLPQTRAEMAMPLIAGDEVVGVLDVQSEKPGRFTEADANVQMTLAAQVASAVQNARLYETIQRRAAEMQTVAELGSEATSALDLDTLLRRAVNLTKERFELYHAHIYLLDEQGAQLVLAAGAGEAGEQMVAAQHRIPANHPRSLVARASRTHQAVIVNDVTAVPDFLPNPLLPNTHSELALPLVIGDQIFGVLDVQSAVTDRFTEQDVAVYTTLASQITAAVQNVRLFETVNDREQQFRALFEQSNDAIFLMRATDGVLVDWNKRTLEYFGAEPEDLVGKTPGDFSPMIQPDGSDSNEKAREMIAAAAAGHPQFFTWMHRRVDGSEFYADISLNSVEVRGEILTQATIRDITERLKAQETIQRRALEMQTVSEVGAAATASLDVNRLLRDVANLTKERFNLYHAHVYLLDDTGENLLLAAGAGQVGQRMASAGHRISTNNERSLVARAARGGQPVLVNDVTKAPDFLPNPMLPMTRSEMAVPLIVGDRVSGVLDVQSDVAGRFTEEDTVVYTTLAGQVSAALRNVSLFETVEEREQLLRTIINTTPDWIYVKDRDYRYLIANQAIAENYGGRTPEEMIGKNDYDLGVAVELIEGNPEKGIRGFRLDDQDVLERGLDVHNPYNVVDYVDGTRHILNTSKLPLRDQDGNIIGVLGVSRDVTEALKAQETIQRRALEMQTVSEVGAAASASLDADQLLSDVANLTKERFELYHTHVYLLDDTGENLLLAAGAGQIGQQMVAAGHRISPDNERSLVARAARSGQPVLVNDVTRAPDFLPNPMLPKTRSEMAVPLIVSDQVIGVLDVQSDVSGRFTEEDAVVYTTLAGQVSAALQNVRLLSTSQRRAVEMQT
ncbi:MAG: GAF domain-containing protein, partial [Chloroflexi bacterium]|nr:GAF domain-containing protein [Chloroflexota bacterium]